MLLGGELRTLQFNVYQANQSIVNEMRDEIEQLTRSLHQSMAQERNEAVYLEGQMGNMR